MVIAINAISKFCNDSFTNEGRRQRKCGTNAQRDLICRAPGTDL